jgi:general secretion pathway protein M
MNLAGLRGRFEGLAPREQRLVTWGGAAALVLLVIAVLLPLQRQVAGAESRIARKQADLAWMRQAAPVLVAAGPAAAPPASQESLVVVVDRSARENGLGQALTGSQPSGDGGLRVQIEKADFNVVATWLARLADQNRITVETATIDGTTEPGLVNAGLVLRQR